ncbi:MAG: YqaE/Pmp3 family membrane protein [Candidatus Tectimicrobiota bacterium]
MPVAIPEPLTLVFAVVLPPLGVFCAVGFTRHFWLNVALTLLGYIPGVVHALYIVLGP